MKNVEYSSERGDLLPAEEGAFYIQLTEDPEGNRTLAIGHLKPTGPALQLVLGGKQRESAQVIRDKDFLYHTPQGSKTQVWFDIATEGPVETLVQFLEQYVASNPSDVIPTEFADELMSNLLEDTATSLGHDLFPSEQVGENASIQEGGAEQLRLGDSEISPYRIEGPYL